MSRTYEAFLREASKPYKTSDSFVCAECVNDEFIDKYVADHGSPGQCSFCEYEGSVIPVNELLKRLEYYLDYVYSANDSDSPVCGGEYVFDDGMHFFDIVEDLLCDSNELLVEHIKDLWDTSNSYYERDIKIVEYECNELFVDWNRFARIIKEGDDFNPEKYLSSNYGCSLYGTDNDCFRLLNYIGDHIGLAGGIKTISADTKIYRARLGQCDISACALGSPPREKSNCNRLSLDGHSCFYGAFSENVCLKEIGYAGNGEYSMGVWTPCRDLRCIDLSSPSFYQDQIYASYTDSIWDSKKLSLFPTVAFLSCFVKEISQRVNGETEEERKKEYRPTQIVGEFFRENFCHQGGKIDGIIFRSAKEPDQNNVVIFCNSDACCDLKTQNDNCVLILGSGYVGSQA